MAQSKQQKERLALAVLLVVAVLVWFFYVRTPKATSGVENLATNYTPINAQDYSVIFKEMGESQSTVYKSSGRNIFVAGAAPVEPSPMTPAAKLPEKIREPRGPMPPPEPPVPVLTMKFFGYGSLPTSGPRRAFLLDGEDIHIVQEGDTVQNHIRITHIGNDRIEYEDTVTGKKNSNTLELPPQA